MFIIHETQYFSDDQFLPVEPAPTAKTEDEALSIYFLKCASASISPVPIHSVTLTNEFGAQIRSEFFDHRPKPTEPNIV